MHGCQFQQRSDKDLGLLNTSTVLSVSIVIVSELKGGGGGGTLLNPPGQGASKYSLVVYLLAKKLEFYLTPCPVQFRGITSSLPQSTQTFEP